MVLTCAISLEPVDYQFNIDIDQWFSFGQEIEREDLIIVEKDELNLINFIWENIFVSIPLKVVKKGAKIPKIQGENWRFISDDNPAEKTKLIIKLEYFNTASSKCLLDVFKASEGIREIGKEIVVYWHFEEDDDDMEEAGEDYQAIVNLPFKLIEVDEIL
jgi:hypothetical protein